jgi:hypothetical protein
MLRDQRFGLRHQRRVQRHPHALPSLAIVDHAVVALASVVPQDEALHRELRAAIRGQSNAIPRPLPDRRRLPVRMFWAIAQLCGVYFIGRLKVTRFWSSSTLASCRAVEMSIETTPTPGMPFRIADLFVAAANNC